MARREDQHCTTLSDAKSRLPPDLRRPRSKRSAQSEPTLDEVLREPAIRLIMRRDNVNEDQLLHLIKLVRRHINGLVSLGSGRSEMSIHLGMWRDGPIAQSKVPNELSRLINVGRAGQLPAL